MNGHCLYRAFSSTGELVYVGISSRVMRRLREHERSSPWWSSVSMVEVEACESRREAAQREWSEILTLAPRHNRAGVEEYPSQRRKRRHSEIRDARMKAGISQTRLSALSGVSLYEIRRVEQGVTSDPRYSTIAAIMDAIRSYENTKATSPAPQRMDVAPINGA